MVGGSRFDSGVQQTIRDLGLYSGRASCVASRRFDEMSVGTLSADQCWRTRVAQKSCGKSLNDHSELKTFLLAVLSVIFPFLRNYGHGLLKRKVEPERRPDIWRSESQVRSEIPCSSSSTDSASDRSDKSSQNNSQSGRSSGFRNAASMALTPKGTPVAAGATASRRHYAAEPQARRRR